VFRRGANDNPIMFRAILAVLSCALSMGADPARAEQPPNIILFLVDDLGQQDVSVPMLDQPTALSRRYRTPNLERLAARGVRFSNAYSAAPVCTPSRTAILGGQSPARTHITYWTLEKDTDTSSRHDRLAQPAWQVNGLQPSPSLLPELLRKAGYRTIHAGKARRPFRGRGPQAAGEARAAGRARERMGCARPVAVARAGCVA